MKTFINIMRVSMHSKEERHESRRRFAPVFVAPAGAGSARAGCLLRRRGAGGGRAEAQQITAPRETERGNGPVEGYVAKRSVSATKTDTPIIETPQSISIITADRIRDRGSLTIQTRCATSPACAARPMASTVAATSR